jgi:hypothetical protein
MLSNTLAKVFTNGKVFLAIQTVILFVIAGSAIGWTARTTPRLSAPNLNSEPRVVGPLHDYPFVVSDEQLELVLEKIKPSFQKQPPKTNFVDHALRLWGVDVEFGDDAIDGRVLRELLVNDQVFDEVWGKSELPLLMPNENGIAVRTQEGRSTVSHVDHLLGSLAEVGTPLDFPIVVRQGDNKKSKATMFDLIEHATNSFRLNQKEYEWTTLALAFYAADAQPWVTQEGQEVDFNRLAKRLMRQLQPQGVCYGQHRVYTLVVLLRINEQIKTQSEAKLDGLLDDETRVEVVDYLKSLTKALYENQSEDGSWDGNWADTSIPVRDPETNELSRQILATGHALEWWAMAPKDLHPPRETIVRAGQWLAREIGSMDDRSVEKNYTFLTHAARALALWRGKFPAEHFERFKQRRGSHDSVVPVTHLNGPAN